MGFYLSTMAKRFLSSAMPTINQLAGKIAVLTPPGRLLLLPLHSPGNAISKNRIMNFMPYVTKQIRACNEKIQKAQEILNNPHTTHKVTVISQVEDATSHLLYAIDALAFADKAVQVLLLYPILAQKIALDNVIDSVQHLNKNLVESSKILRLGDRINSELSETLQPRGKLISEEGTFANVVNHFTLGETEKAFTKVAENYKSPVNELSQLLARRWINISAFCALGNGGILPDNLKQMVAEETKPLSADLAQLQEKSAAESDPKLKMYVGLWVHNNNMLEQLHQQLLVINNSPTPSNQASDKPT